MYVKFNNVHYISKKIIETTISLLFTVQNAYKHNCRTSRHVKFVSIEVYSSGTKFERNEIL